MTYYVLMGTLAYSHLITWSTRYSQLIRLTNIPESQLLPLNTYR